MGANVVAKAWVQIIPEMSGSQEKIAKGLVPGSRSAGDKAGREAGSGFASSFKGAIGALSGIVAAVGFSRIVSEAVAASDATDKFKSTLDFAGLGTPEMEALSKSTRKYADETVYALSDIQNITAQLAANGVPNYDRLAEAAGNLNAVAGGNADTFRSVGMALTQTAGAGKLTTENWNQLANAIPGASGKLQEAMRANGAYTGNFREAMEKGEISAEEFNRAIMDLGFEDSAVEAARSTSTFEGAFGNMQAAVVGGLSDIIGRLKGPVTDAINGLTPVVEAVFGGIGDAVHAVVDNFDKIAPVAAGAAGALAGLAVAKTVSGFFSSLHGSLMLARKGLVVFKLACAINGPVAALGGAVKGLAGALAGALGGPVGIAVAAIAGLVGAFVVAYNTNEDFHDGVQQAWGKIQELAAQVWPYIEQAIKTACDVARQVVQAVWPVIQSVVTTVMDNVQAVVTAVWPLVQQAFQLAGEVIFAIVQAVWPVIQTVITTVMQVIQQVVAVVWPIIQNAFTAAGTAIMGVVNAVFPFIQTVITTVMTVVNAVISTILALIKGDWDGVWNGIKAVAQAVWDGICGIVDAGINAAKGVIESVLGFIKGVWDGAWNGLKDFVSQIWDGIQTGVSNGIDGVMTFIGELPGKITGFFADCGTWLVDSGKALLQGFADGVMGAVGWVGDQISGALSDIRDLFPFSPAKKGPFSGHGYTTYSGKALIGDFGESMVGEVPSVVDMLGSAMVDVRAALSAPDEPSRRAAAGVAVDRGGGDADRVIGWLAENLPAIISECTPVQGESDAARFARRAVAYAV